MKPKFKRITIKIGSNVLTKKDGSLDFTRMSELVDQIAELHKQGVEIILVSSGAVAAGRNRVLADKLDSVSARQLFSAIGQVKLINRYYMLFRDYNITCGQVLTTKESLGTRGHYLNQRNCMQVMINHGVIPIVNENDTISVTELMFTDNDELSGLVATMMDSEALIILSNIDGIYNGNPSDPGVKVIREVLPGKRDLSEYIQTSKSSFGRGGMQTKTNIAGKVADEGVEGEPEVMPENEAALESVIESAVGDSNDPAAVEPEAALVDAVAIEQSVVTQKIQNEIRQTINDATQRMNSDPEGAIQNLKLALVMVRDNTALAPGERNMMLDRLGNTLKQVQHVQYVNDFRQQQADANAAEERERQQLLHDSLAQAVKAEQVFDRFKSLMIAGEYKVASDVATSAMQMLPDSTTPFTAQRLAEMTGNIIEYARLRHQRHVGFVDSLMVAERSFIPVPEEPPLSYIDPERWMILSERRKERYAVSDLSQSGDAERSINKALEKNFTIDLDENSTFEDLIAEIKKQNSDVVINIGLDTAAADEAGVELTLSSPVVSQPASYSGIKLRSVLRLILKEHDLTYCIKDQVLTITTIDEAKLNMSIKVYPVADLVVSPEPIGGMGGGGMGGGMMGGMGGGMGGGMMGGGMGGMGGGMGMFSVPEEINRADFDAAKKIVAEAKKAENVREYWEQFFAQGQVTAEQIEQIVTRLVDEMKAKKPVQEHIIAVVESAILEDMVRPWMYEVLAIALYSNNAPAPEVERAILSAAEFCDNPLDLLNVGFFMRSLGMKQRAFPLYKQALEAMPAPKQEFFAATLRLANELFLEQKDEESLRWVCLAILSFEWDGDNGQKMATDALDLVNVLKNSMERAGRTEEAAKLAQDIQEARLRDCIVTIQWTGDVALDLAVREPTDSFCWFNNPRTLSGGLVKLTPVKEDGKAVTGTMTEAAGAKKISYVCPKGFNGTYVVVVQRDWGTPVNNLVSIAVDTNVVAGEEKAKGSSFTLPPEGAIIQFALETGRRTETLEEAQLDVATIRMSVAQQQLARNAALRRLASDGLLGQVVGGPGGSGQGGYVGSGNSRDRYPFWGRSSVVGYQPVIQQIPDGAMLGSNAVVSADRRYVRMSPSPNFNSVRSVYSYNLQTGVDEQDGTSGMGGMGNNTGGNMSGGMGGSGGGMY